MTLPVNKMPPPPGLNGRTISAQDFVAFMVDVWDGVCVPHEGGGVLMSRSPLYDDYHNAMLTARAIGGIRTGGTKVNGEDCGCVRFPSGARVAIGKGGSSVTPLAPFPPSALP